MRAIPIFAVTTALAAAPAYAEKATSICGPEEVLFTYLLATYGEVPFVERVDVNGIRWVEMINPVSRTWTHITQVAGGVPCLNFWGDNFELLIRPPQETGKDN